MKILLISQDNSIKTKVGGKHIHQSTLINEWRAKGHEVVAVFPDENEIQLSFTDRLLYRLTRKWCGYPVGFFKRYLEAIKKSLKIKIRRKFKKFLPDLISVQDPLAAIACCEVIAESGALYKQPSITMTLHGYYTWEMFNYGYYGEHNRAEIERFGHALEKKALSCIHQVITVDTRIRNYLLHQLNYRGNVKVIFNAIDVSPYMDLHCENQHQDATWKLLITRRMVLKNGVIVAIDALAQILTVRQDVQLVMVGDGPELGRVRKRAEELGVLKNITFIGAVQHELIHRYYKASDILLMPSIPSDGIEEATSLSMLEGMVAGNIVICSAIGGMKEIIRHGVTGYLVEANSPTALANQILEVLALSPMKKKNIVEQARKFVFEYHSASRHAEQVLQLMLKQ